MARDDLEYLSIIDFTPGIYSKYGATTQLGKDGAAQVHDGLGRYTFGCYPDPDGGLRPVPRRVARYGVDAADTKLNPSGTVSAWSRVPTTRGVGVGDGGRRSKIGIIDAAVHHGARIVLDTYDAPPRIYESEHGKVRPDMVHILTSYREDPVPQATAANTSFPALGRLVNRWHSFSLSEVDDATGNVDLRALSYAPNEYNKPHRVVHQKASRVEEMTYNIGGSFPADADFPTEAGSGYTYSHYVLSEWRAPYNTAHNGWAAGSLAVGRSINTLVYPGVVTLDRVKNPGALTVVACLQYYTPYMAEDSSEEVYPNFFSAIGGPFAMYNTNDKFGYPYCPPQAGESPTTWGCAGDWTAGAVPWYLIEHQDRFVGIINAQWMGVEAREVFSGYKAHSWVGPANQIRYTELNAIGRLWIAEDAAADDETTPASGLHYTHTELWKFVETGGPIGFLDQFVGTGTTTMHPSSPTADVLGNNLTERIGCMFSWRGDLVIASTQGEGSIVRGSMEDPTVLRSATIPATGGITCHAVTTPQGAVYGTTDGVYLWTGEEATPISPQLDGWFWDAGEASETHRDGYRRKGNASMGRFGYSAPFVFAPNNWMMDLRTGAWTRLRNPIDENPYPYMHYVTNENGDVYAVRGCYDGTVMANDPFTAESYFMDCYSREERAWEWQWISQPLQSSIVREMTIEDVVVVAQGHGTIEVTVQGDGADDGATVPFPVDSTNRPMRFAARMNMTGTDLVVRISSRGTGTSEDNALSEAPTLHAIHFGSRSAHQINRDN